MANSDLESVLEESDSQELIERIDYDVHLKYVKRIGLLSSGLAISHSLKPIIQVDALKQLLPKLRIIERTKKLLEEEIRCVNDDAEYAQACVGWLPAKVYYNLYHLLAIIEYLVTGKKQFLRLSHYLCLRSLASRLTDGTIQFTCSHFNKVCDKEIRKFKSVSGEVLSNSIADDRLISLVMKKIANDHLDDFRERRGLDCRKVKHKRLYLEEENKLKITILDFFYSMRIRTNYRDMSFLDDLDAERIRIYFVLYYETANNFYNCLNELKNDLITQVH